MSSKTEGKYASLKVEKIEIGAAHTPTQSASSSSSGSTKRCAKCETKFGLSVQKHKCKTCRRAYCLHCFMQREKRPKYGHMESLRICDNCHEKLERPLKVRKETGGSAPFFGASHPKPERAEGQRDKALQRAMAASLDDHRRRRGMEIYEEQEAIVATAISLAQTQQQHDMTCGAAAAAAPPDYDAATKLPRRPEQIPEEAEYYRNPPPPYSLVDQYPRNP